MKIDRLTKRGNNVYIYFDIGDRIRISWEIAVKKGLRKGDELSVHDLSSLVDEDNKFRLKNSAFRLLARRAHSVFELRRKLLSKEDNSSIVNSILHELTERDYLNDEKFALEFMEERLAKKKSGIIKIKSELSARGVNKEFIDKAFRQLYNREQLYDTAFKLAEKKVEIIKRKEEDESKIKLKLMNFLQNRGFDFEIIRDVVRNIFGES